MKIIRLLLVLASLGACVDPLVIQVPAVDINEIVVDGFISDEPGPYNVKLTRSLGITEDLRRAKPFSAQRVIISDNLGNSEELTESKTALGFYQTNPNGIRGIIGRSYTLRIEGRDGKIYESTPQLIRPAGNIDNLYFEFESTKTSDGSTQDSFKIFMDSSSPDGSDNLFRWEFTGTYQVETFPELHDVPCGQARCPDPLPCSGVVLINGRFSTVGPCECCTCWVNQNESSPKVSDNQFVSGGKFKRVEMGLVPVTEYTFFKKYLVEVRQMSLSQDAFDYWKAVQSQQEGASSLFQPPFGQAKTNMIHINGNDLLQGIFYASSVVRQTIFINPDDVPISIPVPQVSIMDACNLAFDFASTIQPAEWQ